MKKSKKRFLISMALFSSLVALLLVGKLASSNSLQASENPIKMSLREKATDKISVKLAITDDLFTEIEEGKTTKLLVELPEQSFVNLEEMMKTNEKSKHFVSIEKTSKGVAFEVVNETHNVFEKDDHELYLDYYLEKKSDHVLTSKLENDEKINNQLEVAPEITDDEINEAKKELLPQPDLMTEEALKAIGKQTRAFQLVTKDPSLNGILSTDFDTLLDEKFAFLPLEYPGLTKFVYVDDETKPYPTIASQMTTGSPRPRVISIKGKGMEFKILNVGVHNGKFVDMVVKVTDYYSPTPTGGKIEYGTSDSLFMGIISTDTKRGLRMDLEYTAYYSGETTPIILSGFIPHGYINANKTITLQNEQITQLFAKSNSVVTTELLGTIGGKQARSFKGQEIGNPDPKFDLTQVYEDVLTRHYRFTLNNTDAFGAGFFQFYNGATTDILVASQKPTLTGSLGDKDSKDMYYQISQFVNPRPEGKEYETYSIDLPINTDVLEKVKVTDVTIFDRFNKLVPRNNINVVEEVGQDGKQKIVIKPTASFLKDNTSANKFYANEFKIKIPVKVNKDSDYSNYLEIVNGVSVISVPSEATLRLNEIWKNPEVISHKASGVAHAKTHNKSYIEMTHQDKQGRIIKKEVASGVIGEAYDFVTDLDQGGYVQLKETEGSDLVGKFAFDNGKIVKTYEDKRFELTSKAKSTSAPTASDIEEVKWEDTIDYTVKLKSNIAKKATDLLNPSENFKVSKFETTYPSAYLKKATNVKLYTLGDVGEKLEITGATTITDSKITTEINPAMTTNWTKDVYLEFSADVKLEAPTGKIIEVTTSNVSTFNGVGLQNDSKTTHRVKVGLSVLEIIQMPDKIDFGSDNKLSLKDKEIYPTPLTKDEHIIIQDNRQLTATTGWKLELKLEDEFHGNNNNDLADVLKYKKGDQYIDISTSNKLVHSMISKDRDAVNLSKDWAAKKEGLVLVVPGNGTVIADQYEAKLIWTVSDTP